MAAGPDGPGQHNRCPLLPLCYPIRRLQRLEGIVRAIGQGQGVDAGSVAEASRAVAALRQQLQEIQQGQVGYDRVGASVGGSTSDGCGFMQCCGCCPKPFPA